MQLVSEYYKEKVLSLDKKDRILRELPADSDDVRIEQDLFCWKLYSGKKYIQCRSEEEAKYLRVFLESGRYEVYVPANGNHLKEILPQLLYLKKRHDEIIEDRIDGLINPRLQERARQKIWSKIFSRVEDIDDVLVGED